MQTQGSDIIETPEITPKRSHLLEVLAIFTRLGLTSFGGPVAHLGYFREEIVVRRLGPANRHGWGLTTRSNAATTVA